MLVWKAISSMTLMILEILSLEALISFMDVVIRRRCRLASSIRCEATSMFSAATLELPAFLLVMELISSLDAEVSSRDAACSEDPCASDWLEPATCAAASEICVAP
jgi:hypothetical protein